MSVEPFQPRPPRNSPTSATRSLSSPRPSERQLTPLGPGSGTVRTHINRMQRLMLIRPKAAKFLLTFVESFFNRFGV